MSVLIDRLEANRKATDAFLAAMDRDGCLTLRAPGKWTPSQFVEPHTLNHLFQVPEQS